MALGDLQDALENDRDQPFTLVQHGTDWVIKPKCELFRLLSSPRKITVAVPLGMEDLAVLMMIICYRIKGGATQNAITSIFGRNVTMNLERLIEGRLIYADPERSYHYWKPTQKVLEELGYARFEDIPGVQEFKSYIDTLDKESSLQGVISASERILQREQRKKSRQLARASSLGGT
jgi:chromosome segregation and condensation protein ScpB